MGILRRRRAEDDPTQRRFDEAGGPEGGMRMVRGHSGSPKDVHLPEGWLDARDDEVAMPKGAEALVSGG